MSVTVATTYKNSGDLVHWLQENVGPVLHSKPLIYWHGASWHMRSYYVTNITTGPYRDHGWSVEFNREEDAVLFKLRWA